MAEEFSVFVLDDDVAFCKLLATLVDHEIFTSKLPDHTIVLYTHHDMKDIVGAVARIQSTKPDLVLLDYMLGLSPGSCLNSLAILKKVIPYCGDIKLVSGLYGEDIRLKLLKDTLDSVGIGFLSKPFGVDELVAVIKHSIQRKENGV